MHGSSELPIRFSSLDTLQSKFRKGATVFVRRKKRGIMEISCGFGFIQFRSKMRRKFSMRIHVSDTRFRREIMSSI